MGVVLLLHRGGMQRQPGHGPHGQVHPPLGVGGLAVDVVGVLVLGAVGGMRGRVAAAVGRLQVGWTRGAYGGRGVLHVVMLGVFFFDVGRVGLAGAVFFH